MYLHLKDGCLVRVNSLSVDNGFLLRRLRVNVRECVMDWESWLKLRGVQDEETTVLMCCTRGDLADEKSASLWLTSGLVGTRKRQDHSC